MPHKTTVTFSGRAEQTLENIMHETGDSMVETLRKALAIYRWYRTSRTMGHQVGSYRDGTFHQITYFD